MATVALLGTCDTKLEELLYLRNQIKHYGQEKVEVLLIDVGRSNTESGDINITQAELVSKYGGGQPPAELPRGGGISFMTSCAAQAIQKLYHKGAIHGIAAAGGSGGTSLVAPVMRDALPIGFPKLIVSTVASGDTGNIVGESDITLMYSVVDVAGLNDVLRNVLSNAGAAIAGAALAYAERQTPQQSTGQPAKRRVGLTMFGVTTPGVDAIRRHLEASYDIETYVFHATGHGGRAMEKLVAEGQLDAVLDLTTTEICDLVAGGVMSADPTRLDAAVKAGIPNVVSLGATDMVNFGPTTTVPERYGSRNLFKHNPVVTLMRTSQEDCKQIGEFIVKKLKESKRADLVQVWIPKGGVSMISTKDGPFEDTEADNALFKTIRDGLNGTKVEVIEDHRDINDEGFAKAIAEALVGKMKAAKLL
jgi:uncharacterized protein (UPF0261 family)